MVKSLIFGMTTVTSIPLTFTLGEGWILLISLNVFYIAYFLHTHPMDFVVSEKFSDEFVETVMVVGTAVSVAYLYFIFDYLDGPFDATKPWRNLPGAEFYRLPLKIKNQISWFGTHWHLEQYAFRLFGLLLLYFIVWPFSFTSVHSNPPKAIRAQWEFDFNVFILPVTALVNVLWLYLLVLNTNSGLALQSFHVKNWAGRARYHMCRDRDAFLQERYWRHMSDSFTSYKPQGVSAKLYEVFGKTGNWISVKDPSATEILNFMRVECLGLLDKWFVLRPVVKGFSTEGIRVIRWMYIELFTDSLTYWLLILVTISMLVLYVTIAVESSKQYLAQHVVINSALVLMVICYTTKDLLHFFIAFEILLIPLFFLVGIGGSRSARIRASQKLLIFTLTGSIFLWIAILYTQYIFGSSSFSEMMLLARSTKDVQYQSVIWWCLFLGLAFKVPLVPFHLWLTTAHVESPTPGSMVLASLVLKLGAYGILRFLVLLFPDLTVSFSNTLLGLCCVGYTYATLSAIRQLDIKRFIAYTSIAHMNFGLAVLFTVKEVGIMAFCHTMVSHGIISSGLFFLIGFVYRQVGLRDTLYLRGLANIIPYFALGWFVFSMANVGMPLLSGFPGEFYGLVALTMKNRFLVLAFSVGFYFTGVYTFLNVSRVLYGSPSRKLSHLVLSDLGELDILIVVYLVFWSVGLGVFPDMLFNSVLSDMGDFMVIKERVSKTWTEVHKAYPLEFASSKQKFLREMEHHDNKCNIIPADADKPVQIKSTFVKNAGRIYSLLNYLQIANHPDANQEFLRKLYASKGYNINYSSSLQAKNLAESRYNDGLFVETPVAVCPNPEVPGAYLRVVFTNNGTNIRDVEDWVSIAPSIWIEAATGVVVRVEDGVGQVWHARFAQLPDPGANPYGRRVPVTSADMAESSAENTFTVTARPADFPELPLPPIMLQSTPPTRSSAELVRAAEEFFAARHDKRVADVTAAHEAKLKAEHDARIRAGYFAKLSGDTAKFQKLAYRHSLPKPAVDLSSVRELDASRDESFERVRSYLRTVPANPDGFATPYVVSNPKHGLFVVTNLEAAAMDGLVDPSTSPFEKWAIKSRKSPSAYSEIVDATLYAPKVKPHTFDQWSAKIHAEDTTEKKDQCGQGK